MLLVIAILLTLFFLPSPWGEIAIICAAVIEVSQTGFWFWYTHRERPTVGREAMIGARGEVVEALRPEGWVRVHGELWRARSEEPLEAGVRVRVREMGGLTLRVERG